MNSGICKEKLVFSTFDFNYLQEENNQPSLNSDIFLKSVKQCRGFLETAILQYNGHSNFIPVLDIVGTDFGATCVTRRVLITDNFAGT